ncbi:unnamed protein product [Blepharisma stoltei]|uniref:Uncharacterized protein n=1 Tax=Blepharisma stoltei TaxID=1481888 RepID=A0AAU9IS38_9CILI|nr:unnamed protein product [Blepharisma stoltei]
MIIISVGLEKRWNGLYRLLDFHAFSCYAMSYWKRQYLRDELQFGNISYHLSCQYSNSKDYPYEIIIL